MKRLNTKIMLLMCTICVAILLVSSVVNYIVTKNVLEEESISKLSEISKQHAYKINTWFEVQGQIIEEIGDNIIYNNNYDYDYLFEYLKGKTEMNEDIYAVYLGFTDKKSIFGDGWIPPDDYDCTERAWYQDAVRAQEMVFSSPYLDFDTGKIVITIAKPLYNNEDLIGVLAADIMIDKVIEIVDNAKPSESSYGFIVDNNNNIISHAFHEFLPSVDGKMTDGEEVLKNLETVQNNIYKELTENTNHKIELVDYDGSIRYFSSADIESTGWTIYFSMLKTEVNAPLNRIIKSTLITSLIFIIMTIGIAKSLSKSITKPIIKLVHQAEQISNFNIAEDVPQDLLAETNELGTLSMSFQSVIESLRQFVEHISLLSNHVSSSAEKLTVTSEHCSNTALVIEQIAYGSTDQAKHTEEGANSINEFGSLIEKNKILITELTQSITEIDTLKEEGFEILYNLTQKTDKRNDDTKQVNDIILRISESTKEIQNVSLMIDKIADQTNLLAFNATLEAAKAGESGTGFAVVAVEIRKLAEQSTNFTKEIGDIINELSKEIYHAVDTMKYVETSMLSQTTNMELTNDKFDGIGQALSTMNNLVDDINNSSRGMVERKEVIVEIMQNLAIIAQKNASTTQETANSVEKQTDLINEFARESESLTSLATQMQETVSKFKI